MKEFRIIIPVIVLLVLGILKMNLEAASLSTNSSTIFPDTINWVLTKIPENKTMKQHTGAKVFIRINTTKKMLSGYTSCNSIKSKVVLQDSTISITEVVAGNRVCDERTMGMEKLFRKIIQKSTSWKIVNNMLYLYENGNLLLEFKSENGK